MKKYLTGTLALLLIFGMFTSQAFATELVPACQEVQVVALADGGSLTITREAYTVQAANTANGATSYTRTGSNGSTLWTATLAGTFTYNGTSSTCTDAAISFSINDSHYYVVSKSVSKSGNTATADFTIGYKLLGVTYNTESYTITLSCDKNGNLS